MSSEPGGIASKLGSIYERHYAVELLLRMLAGRVRRVRWEPASGEAGGADIDVEYPDDVLEHVQLKRQNRGKGKWSVADLDRAGVLASAAAHVDLGQNRRFVFVSADRASPPLRDICEQLTRNSDSAEMFRAEHVDSDRDRKRAFEELLNRWNLDSAARADVELAIARLARIRFSLRDCSDDGAETLLLQVQLALTGDPVQTTALLERYMEGHLRQDVFVQALQQFLARYDVRPHDLARDRSLPTAIGSLQQEFLAALRERLIDGSLIDRPAVAEIVGEFQGQDPPRIVIVRGKPGAGKSAVMFAIVDSLVARGVPVLPISLSVRPTEGDLYAYGESLGLGATPVAALRAIAGTRRAAIVVDQLDALRLTTASAAATWHSCLQLLRSAVADSNTVLVVACRSFDLDNDPQIRQWKEHVKRDVGRVADFNVDDLDPEAVAPVLQRLGVDYSDLPPRLQLLLRHPGSLEIWYRIVSGGSTRRDFASQTQLLSALINQLRLEATRLHNASDQEVQAVLDRTRERMESSGRLIAPKSAFTDLPTAVQACCEVGLLVSSGASLSFPHQSYFDHMVAQATLRESGQSVDGIVSWTKEDQSLARRDQLRQLLFLLRDEDPALMTGVSEALLLDPNVRFHLKQLILGVLRECDPVSPEDAAMVVRLACVDGWAHHLRDRVLWRSVSWFDAISATGTWVQWLANPDAQERLEWLNVACSVIRDRPEQVDTLIRPLLATQQGVDELARVAPFRPREDSPLVAQIREREVARGRWRLQSILLDQTADCDPARALRLVVAVLHGLLHQGLHDLRAGEHPARLRDHLFGEAVAKAIRLQSEDAFEAFERLLLVCERLRARLIPALNRIENLTIDRFRTSSFFDEFEGTLAKLFGHALSAISESAPAKIAALVNSASVRESKSLSTAVAAGMRQADGSVADTALLWLIEDKARLRLRTSDDRDAHGLAADLIRHFGANCSDEVLQQVEEMLLTYWPSEEVELYRFRLEARAAAQGHPVGAAQHLLLAAIPETRRSITVRARLALWDAKFGGPPVRRDWRNRVRGGRIVSPIPQDRLPFVSDKQWIKIAMTEWSDPTWTQLDSETAAESSHEHFAIDFGQCAKKDPGRFARLISLLPRTAPPEYLGRTLDALADKSTDVAACAHTDLELILELAVEHNEQYPLISACRMIESHPDLEWSEAAWRLLEHAALHDDPSADRGAVDGGGDERYVDSLESISLNSVRGTAAAALGALAWNRSSRAERALPIVRHLAHDPHPAVRLAAAQGAFGIYTVNGDAGLELLLLLTGHEDDRVLAGQWPNKLARHVRWSHPGSLDQLFARMAHSAQPTVAQKGAGWVAAEFFQQKKACSALYRECAAGTAHQRVGVALTLTQIILDDNADRAAVEQALAPYFDDPDESVRAAAAEVFSFVDLLASDSGERLAETFVKSTAFREHPETLMRSLEREPVDLCRYATVVLATADRFAGELAAQTRSIQQALGHAGRDLSSLLLRLYDAALKRNDRALAEACLDRWDRLLENRVGDAAAHLEEYTGE